MKKFGRARTTAVVLVAVSMLIAGCSGTGNNNAGGKGGSVPDHFSLTIAANAVKGGKNNDEAVWIVDDVIPGFEKQMKAQGKTADVKFVGRGVSDEDYKTQLALDLKTGGGADIMDIDDIWVGEFAQANYLKPLASVVGSNVDSWDGWSQIPKSVQGDMSFSGKRYGIAYGTDGRVLFFNKKLFQQAGLTADWQPKSWDDILTTAKQLKAKLPGVTPLQINAGTAMGEATTMQGFLPLLVGTGKQIYDPSTQKWLGDTPAVRQVLQFYSTVYGQGLGDPQLQLRADGRDRSFQDFSKGKIAVLAEGDYFWRSVVAPKTGIDPMPDRDQVVGYTKMPAVSPGNGINNQDFVSMSGGGGRVLNPNTKYPAAAWALLTYMNSKEAVTQYAQLQPRITQRQDVNEATLADEPLLSFISKQVLPISATRPGLAVYPDVSQAIQLATQDVVAGKSPADAATSYQKKLEGIVGADHVASGG